MDYDADGDLDILSGSYTGEIYFFERTSDGDFRQGRYLVNVEGEPLVTGSSVTPEAMDIDADGDLDLVIGTRRSGVAVFENQGTRAEPIWPVTGRPLLAEDGSAVAGSNAHHADWDGDGRRDLIAGNERGGAMWYRNTGANDRPSYAPGEMLVKQASFGDREEDVIAPGSHTKLHVTDWNGDGRGDLLLGDFSWERYTLPPLTPEEEAEMKAFKPQYNEAQATYWKVFYEHNSYVEREGGIPEEVLKRYEEASEVFAPLSDRWYEFSRDRSRNHGYVWLYLR